MKKTLATIATAVIMMFSLQSFAGSSNPLKGLDSKALLSTYIESASLGSTDYSKYMLTDDFEFVNTSNDQKFNKRQYLDFLKNTKGLKFDAKVSYEILEESGNACIAKSEYKFSNFTRVDYITLNKTNDGWKVSRVVTTYP